MGANDVIAHDANDKDMIAPVLVVAPASVLGNWSNELVRWADFSVWTFSSLGALGEGGSDTTFQDAKAARQLLEGSGGKNGATEIVLASYEAVRVHSDSFFSCVRWGLLVFDEVHRLKNPEAKTTIAVSQLRVTRRVGLTGTPVQNNLKELHAVMAACIVGPAWPSQGLFLQHFARPIEQGREQDASDAVVQRGERRARELQDLLSNYFLRRTKELLAAQLQGKDDEIVFCSLTPWQRMLLERLEGTLDYEMVATAQLPCSCGSKEEYVRCCMPLPLTSPDELRRAPIWSTLPSHLSPDGHYKCCKRCPFCLVFPLISYMFKIASHYKLMLPERDDARASGERSAGSSDPERDRSSRSDDERNAESHMPRVRTEQAHQNWESSEVLRKRRDELVSRAVLGDDYNRVGAALLENSDVARSAKLKMLDGLLLQLKQARHRVLVFSQFARLLDVVQDLLVRRGYLHERLDGSVPNKQRQSLVERFNRGSAFVFLISTRAGGLGLNVTAADRVVVLDPMWNPTYDLQAQDRSYRLGQTRHVKVYRLLAAHTLEEAIYSRQVSKQQLALAALDRDAANEMRYFKRSDLTGLASLFSFQASGAANDPAPRMKRVMERARRQRGRIGACIESSDDLSETAVESAPTQIKVVEGGDDSSACAARKDQVAGLDENRGDVDVACTQAMEEELVLHGAAYTHFNTTTNIAKHAIVGGGHARQLVQHHQQQSKNEPALDDRTFGTRFSAVVPYTEEPWRPQVSDHERDAEASSRPPPKRPRVKVSSRSTEQAVAPRALSASRDTTARPRGAEVTDGDQGRKVDEDLRAAVFKQVAKRLGLTSKELQDRLASASHDDKRVAARLLNKELRAARNKR